MKNTIIKSLLTTLATIAIEKAIKKVADKKAFNEKAKKTAHIEAQEAHGRAARALFSVDRDDAGAYARASREYDDSLIALTAAVAALKAVSK